MEGIMPRARGSLLSNRIYQLFAWGAALPNILNRPVYAAVTVLPPADCGPPNVEDPQPQSPFSQTFCSIIANVGIVAACQSPVTGSPVLWSNMLTGILISENGCEPYGIHNMLRYHNVAEFGPWIDEVSAGKITKMSAIVILSALFVSLKNLF